MTKTMEPPKEQITTPTKQTSHNKKRELSPSYKETTDACRIEDASRALITIRTYKKDEEANGHGMPKMLIEEGEEEEQKQDEQKS